MDESARMLGGAKIFQHMDRLAVWQARELPPPVTVELDLTNLCNHACPGCSFSYLVNVSKDSIPLETAADVIDQIAAFGVKAITFSGGGEPLVYGRGKVLGLMQLAKNHGLDVALITNGSLLDDPQFLGVCQWIRVSLDGYDADTFARFHGRNDKEFAKVVANVRKMAAVKRASTLGVGFLTDSGTIERRDYWKMAEFCAGIEGLDYVQFRPLVVNMVDDPTLQGGGAALSQAEYAEHVAAYQEARQAFSRPSFRVLMSSDKYASLAQPKFGRTYNRCHAHFLEAVVSADCKIYICCHGQSIPGFCLGDLRQNTFAEIWHSEQAKRIYESINPQKHCPPACRLHPQNAILQQFVEPVTHPNFI